MPYDFLLYYSPELMAILFIAAVILGVIIGYFLWGSKREAALAKEQQVSELRQRLDGLLNDGTALRHAIRMIN